MHLCSGCYIELSKKKNIKEQHQDDLEPIITNRQTEEKASTSGYQLRNVTSLPSINQQTQETSPASKETSANTTPSTAGSLKVILLQSQYNTLEKVAKIFNITLPNFSVVDPTSSSFRPSSELNTCPAVLKAVKDVIPYPIDNNDEDITEITTNIKNIIQQTEDVQQKLQLLKLLPRNWSPAKLKALFGDDITPYMLREFKKTHTIEDDIVPIKNVGRPSLESDVKDNVLRFYYQDDISRPFPGWKDTISVKQPDGTRKKLQKRLLLENLSVLHETYLQKCTSENEKLSLTSFKKLRPKECVFAGDSSAHNVCVCMIHENTKFYIQGLTRLKCFEDTENDQSKLLEKLIQLSICENPTEACFLQDCDTCDPSKMVDYVATRLDEIRIEEIKFSLWVTTPRCDLTNQEMKTDEFLDSLRRQLLKFIVHRYKVDKQIGTQEEKLCFYLHKRRSIKRKTEPDSTKATVKPRKS